MSQTKPSTISDVAAAVGVSKTTISRYLNGKTEFMSEETKNRIEQVIRELDYTPSRAARTLKIRKTGVLGCIIADIANPFSSILVKGVSDMCEEKGYQLLIVNTNETPDKEEKAIEALVGHDVEGLIINSTGQTNDYLLRLHEQGLPVVMADRGIEGNRLDTVETDNIPEMHKGVTHLKEKGFASIAFFTQDPRFVATRAQRRAGFEKAADEMYPAGAARVFVLDVTDPALTRTALQELHSMPAPRAIFTNNGVMTLHVLQIMHEEGWKIPTDFGVLGFDDWGWMEVTTPSVSAIRQDSYKIGRYCVQQVLKRIDTGGKHRPQCKRFPAQLIERESTQIEKPR